MTPKKKFVKDDCVWYSSVPVGHNTLGNTVKKLCELAGIQGHHTNHSLRATTATLGLAKGIPDKMLMERTGHRSVKSLHAYQRPSEEVKEKVSEILQGTVDTFYDAPVAKKVKYSGQEEENVNDNNQFRECNKGGVRFVNCNVYFGNVNN